MHIKGGETKGGWKDYPGKKFLGVRQLLIGAGIFIAAGAYAFFDITAGRFTDQFLNVWRASMAEQSVIQMAETLEIQERAIILEQTQDTYGGSTPEETWRLFVLAARADAVQINQTASRYFWRGRAAYYGGEEALAAYINAFIAGLDATYIDAAAPASIPPISLRPPAGDIRFDGSEKQYYEVGIPVWAAGLETAPEIDPQGPAPQATGDPANGQLYYLSHQIIFMFNERAGIWKIYTL